MGDFISNHSEHSRHRALEYKADSKSESFDISNKELESPSQNTSFDGLLSSPKSLDSSEIKNSFDDRDSFKRELDREEMLAFLNEGRETEIHVSDYIVDETTSCFGGSDE